MLKKKALKAASVRKAPATPISAEPATTAPMRSPATLSPWPSAAAGFSPTVRSASPSGVRYSTQPTSGTASSASSVSGVCAFSTGTGSQDMGAKGSIVGGVSTLGKLTR